MLQCCSPIRRALLTGIGLSAIAIAGLPTLASAAAPPVAKAQVVVGSELTRGQTLAAGESLRSPGGRYSLGMYASGILQLDKAPNQVSPDTYSTFLMLGHAGSRLVLQTDGNLVLYGPDNTVRFASGTAGSSAQRLVAQDDGNVVLYGPGGQVLYQSATESPFFLEHGGSLLPGERLTSADGGTSLVMQGDGNLVLYTGGVVRFATSSRMPGSAAVLQNDGNFVVYAPGGQPVFATGTDAGVLETTQMLIVENRQAEITNSLRRPYARAYVQWGSQWGTATLEAGTRLLPGDRRTAPGGVTLIMQLDGNLV